VRVLRVRAGVPFGEAQRRLEPARQQQRFRERRARRLLEGEERGDGYDGRASTSSIASASRAV
jgi:hypothetical protein